MHFFYGAVREAVAGVELLAEEVECLCLEAGCPAHSQCVANDDESKNADNMKMLVLGPWRKAIAVAIDTAKAEWLDGIPPVFQKKVSITSRKL